MGRGKCQWAATGKVETAPKVCSCETSEDREKKEKQELIEAKAKGASGVAPNTDTVEKRKTRSGAYDLLNILRNKRVEYGQDPERAFPEEVVACARLGTKFFGISIDR